MRSLATLLVGAILLYGGLAAPAVSDCSTITSYVTVPTITFTWQSTFLETTTATTADWYTYTDWIVIPTTKTLNTITTTVTGCILSGTTTGKPSFGVLSSLTTAPIRPKPTVTIAKRQVAGKPSLVPSCTVTVTSTTRYDAAFTELPANETRTYTQYSEFSSVVLSSTTSSGTVYVIATATTTTCKVCSPTTTPVVTSGYPPSTISYNKVCSDATSADVGPSQGARYGLAYLDDTPFGGATFKMHTPDHWTCCQQCVEQQGCAASAFDVRTNECRLEFPVDSNGGLNCGFAAQAYWNAGPVAPMAPGSGWWVNSECGYVALAPARPDDGT